MCEAMFFGARVNKQPRLKLTCMKVVRSIILSGSQQNSYVYLRLLPRNGHVKSLLKQRPTVRL